jgi:hypothetical protein
MRSARLLLLCSLLGIASAVVTLYVQRFGPEVLVASVYAGPADDEYAPALVGGWPLWWVQDHPGVSVWGVLAPIGEDRVRGWAFVADAAIFAAASFLLALALRRLRS